MFQFLEGWRSADALGKVLSTRRKRKTMADRRRFFRPWLDSLEARCMLAALGEPALNAAEDLRLDTGEVNDLTVDRYTWRDSQGRPRSVSLVQYGQTLNALPRGGYANQLTFQELDAATSQWSTVYIDPPAGRGDAGFGYFVSHEVYRTFDANVCPGPSNYCTIARVHGEDDSPLALRLPGTGETVRLTNAEAEHQFELNYPHWGTTAPIANPESQQTPSDFAAHQKYNLPVTIQWQFAVGTDFPQWTVNYDFAPSGRTRSAPTSVAPMAT